jgi:CelD/BcsL family acetyltransferase involved in cellulose biosynthesis
MQKDIADGTVNPGWVSTWEAFAELADSWNLLANLTDSKSVFLRHDWFKAAWQWRSHDASIAILCIRQQERIIGILPLAMERQRRYSITARCLCSFDIPDTQQSSMLCAPEDARIVADAMGKELRRTSRSRDCLQLRKLYDTAANAALLGALRTFERVSITIADTCPCIDLNDRWDSYYSRRSRRLKKGNNLIANRLKKAFQAIDVTRVPLDSSAAGERALTELYELSSGSWKKELETALHRPGPQAWTQSLRRTLGDSGALCAWMLRLDGALAAAELQLDYSGSVSALRADTREEFEKYGAGTYLSWKLLEKIMGRPAAHLYNMGPGLNEYKERWAEKYDELSFANWFSPTIRGRLLWAIDHRIKPLVKKMTRPPAPAPAERTDES